MANTTFIYSLIDPRDYSTRYVGKADLPEIRYKNHLYLASLNAKRGKKLTHKENWLRELETLNLYPILGILAEVSDADHEYWEEFFIRTFIDSGANLTNWDELGQGCKYKKRLASPGERAQVIGVNYFDLEGRHLGTLPSLREAARILGVSHANISRCCKGEYDHAGGFVFRYENDTRKVTPITSPNAQRKTVLKVTANGEVTGEYSSIEEAAKANQVNASGVSRVCNGKRKSINKLFFKFKTHV